MNRLCNFGVAWRGVGHVVTPLRFCALGSGVGNTVLVMGPWGGKPNSVALFAL